MEHTNRSIQLKAELDGLRPLAPEVERKVLDKLRLDWNYHSNHLEGNQLDYGETKALLLHGITAQGKPLRDHLEIRGHNDAVLQLLDMARNNAPISQTDIRNLHKMILGEPYEVNAETPDGSPSRKQVIPGEYKTQPNHVRTATGEMFRFAEPFEVPSKMSALMDWLEKQRGTASNPILVASTFHYEFVRIHPFDDGNGRMARLLMNLELMRAGFPPAVIRTEEKNDYFNALRQADGGNLAAFAEHIAERVERSLSTMLAAAKGEPIDEPSDLDKKLFLLEQNLKAVGKIKESTRTDSSVLSLLDNLFAPICSRIDRVLEKFDKFFDSPKSFVFLNNGTTGDDLQVQLKRVRELLSLPNTDPRFATPESLAYEKSFRNSRIVDVGDVRIRVEISLTRNYFSAALRYSAKSDSFTISLGQYAYDTPPQVDAISRALDEVTNALLKAIERSAGVNARA